MEAQAAHVTADTLLSFTENKWQTQDSWMELLGWLDAKLNPAGEGRDWILVLDLASVHKAEAAVKATPKHIHLCFIPAGATSYLQPCDKALFKSWKSSVARSCSDALAEAVVRQRLPVSQAYDFGTANLRLQSVGWARRATAAVKADENLRGEAWKHLTWSAEEGDSMYREAESLHTHGKLFIKDVATEPAVDEDELDPENAEEDAWGHLEKETEIEEKDAEQAAVPQPAVLEGPASAGSPSEGPSFSGAPKAKAVPPSLTVLQRYGMRRLVYGRGPPGASSSSK